MIGDDDDYGTVLDNHEQWPTNNAELQLTNLGYITTKVGIDVISLRFNGHFPRLANTRMFLFWILLELRMTEVLVTTGATRRTNLQSSCHHQQTNTQFFLQVGCSSCRPTNNVQALKELI